jgi:hypothetical protein
VRTDKTIPRTAADVHINQQEATPNAPFEAMAALASLRKREVTTSLRLVRVRRVRLARAAAARMVRFDENFLVTGLVCRN